MIPRVVLAPMAGGISTPALAAAVCEAGGLGILAAGYRTPDQVREEIAELRRRTEGPFGLNVLLVDERPVDREAVGRYAASLAPEAARYGVVLGEPRFDDDDRAEKVEIAAAERVPHVSFAFACPHPAEVEALHAAGAKVWVTVTEPGEAVVAREAGADVLVAQGVEAGGHRGTFDDAGPLGELGLLTLLRLVTPETDLPVVAAGGIMDAQAVYAALTAGAVAVQAGTAFMLCPEAGTRPAHREAFRTGEATALTRAFTGRRARGIVNRFLREHSAEAPAAYPHVHHLTRPLRGTGEGEVLHLWAGQGFRLARAEPAADVVRRLAR